MMRDARHAAAWPLVLLFILFAWFRHAETTAVASSADEVSAVYLARAVIENGSLRITEQVKKHGDFPGKLTLEGESFASGAPGLAALSLLPTLFAKAVAWLFGADPSTAGLLRWLRLLLVQFPAALALYALSQFLVRRGVHAHSARFAALATGLIAPGIASIATLSAGLCAGLCIALVMILLGDDEDWPSSRTFIAAGVFAGLAALLSYSALPVVMVLAVYAFTRARNPQWVLGYLAGPVLAVALLVAYHYFAFGSFVAVPDGAGAWHFWGWHLPTFSQFGDTFIGPTGLLTLAPIVVVVPLGFVFMVSRGDVAESAVLALGALLAILTGAITHSSSPDFGGTHIALVLMLCVWPLGRAAEGMSGISGGPLLMGLLGAWSVLTGALIVATHVYLPADYANPLRDLSFVMVRDGVYCSGLGHNFGLHGDLALLPWAVVMLAVLGVIAQGGMPLDEDQGWRRIVSVLLLAGSLSLWQLSWGPEPHTRERYLDTIAVEKAKERARAPDARLVRRALDAKESDPQAASTLLSVGQAATSFGDNAAALDAYRLLETKR